MKLTREPTRRRVERAVGHGWSHQAVDAEPRDDRVRLPSGRTACNRAGARRGDTGHNGAGDPS
jgi:hypothetical protein